MESQVAVRGRSYQRVRSPESPLRLSPKRGYIYQSPHQRNQMSYNEIIGKPDIVPSPSPARHYASMNSSMYQQRSSGVEYQQHTVAENQYKTFSTDNDRFYELRAELGKSQRMYSDLKERNALLTRDNQDYLQQINALKVKLEKDKSIHDDQTRLILKEKYDLEIQLNVARSKIPVAQERQEYNGQAMQILESQLLGERKRVMQQDLRIQELEQLLAINTKTLERMTYDARPATTTKNLKVHDYGNLPLNSGPGVPSTLSRAKRALEESEELMKNGYLYQPARVDQVRLSSHPDNAYTSIDQRNRETTYKRQYETRWDSLYSENGNEEKLYQRMQDKIRQDEFPENKEDSQIRVKVQSEEKPNQVYQQVRSWAKEEDHSRHTREEDESPDFKQLKIQTEQEEEPPQEDEQDESEEEEFEGEDDDYLNSAADDDYLDPKRSREDLESLSPVDKLSQLEQKSTPMSREPAYKTQSKQVSAADDIDRDSRENRTLPEKPSKYSEYSETSTPNPWNGNSDKSDPKGRDSAKDSRKRQSNGSSAGQDYQNQYSPQFQEQVNRAKEHARNISNDPSLSPDARSLNNFEEEWRKKKEEIASQIDSGRSNQKIKPKHLANKEKSPNDRRHWRNEEPDASPKPRRTGNVRQVKRSRSKRRFVTIEDSPMDDSPEREIISKPKYSSKGTPGSRKKSDASPLGIDDATEINKRLQGDPSGKYAAYKSVKSPIRSQEKHGKSTVSIAKQKQVLAKSRNRSRSQGTQKRTGAGEILRKPHCGVCARRYGDEWNPMKGSPNHRHYNC